MRIGTRPATDQDLDFLWQLEVAGMREVIDRVRGWDEPAQRKSVELGLQAGFIRIIQVNGEDVGMYDLAEYDTYWNLYQFTILPEWQNRGIGTHVLRQISGQVAETGKPLRLRVFKINPAQRLYRRVGFVIMGETDVDYQMAWQAQ